MVLQFIIPQKREHYNYFGLLKTFGEFVPEGFSCWCLKVVEDTGGFDYINIL